MIARWSSLVWLLLLESEQICCSSLNVHRPSERLGEHCGPVGHCDINAECHGSCAPPGPCASVICVCEEGFAGKKSDDINGRTCKPADLSRGKRQAEANRNAGRCPIAKCASPNNHPSGCTCASPYEMAQSWGNPNATTCCEK